MQGMQGMQAEKKEQKKNLQKIRSCIINRTKQKHVLFSL